VEYVGTKMEQISREREREEQERQRGLEQTRRAEEQMRQEILRMEGRGLEASARQIEQQVKSYRAYGVEESLVERWQALKLLSEMERQPTPVQVSQPVSDSLRTMMEAATRQFEASREFFAEPIRLDISVPELPFADSLTAMIDAATSRRFNETTSTF